ncbi:tetratricopeptide repeat protein [Sphingobacterium griseoflavum]|nr:tetratricopeptide repeat protein [Sphingobacterium griseoflavum]
MSFLARQVFSVEYAAAQAKMETLDPAGYVNKYDTNFNGIGPKVYVLPAPRTREELLIDSYNEKTAFQDSIDRALDFQQLLEDFKSTSNLGHIQYLLSPTPETPLAWNNLVEQEILRGNYSAAYGLLHAYAANSLRAGAIHQTIGLLQSALQQAQKTPNTMDVATIQYNLGNVYLFDKNIQEAGFFQESYYKHALKQQQTVEQANALVKIALVQAYDKDYRSAENNIIRKAIPLLNKVKAYEHKINAWQTLAKIYQLQNKHTEAQWFLIQARDLAKAKNYPNSRAEIEYMLAFSKFIQKNYTVAQKEFLQADALAKTEDNKLLQLAIVDKLGQIYMSQHELNKAEDALKSYDDLRQELFKD